MSKHHNILLTRTSFFTSSAGNMENVQGMHVHLLIYYPMKVPQNCFNSFNCSNQTDMQVSKFRFVLDK